jgi:hypothetical protein
MERMGTAIQRRQARLATPELRKKQRLTRWEHFVAYAPVYFVFGGALLLGVAFSMTLNNEPWPMFTTAWTFGGVSTILGIIWVCLGDSQDSMNKDILSIGERKEQVRADRLRRTRPHRDNELTRLKDVEYARYSLMVTSKGNHLKLLAISHQKKRRFGMKWDATSTKELFSSRSGKWGNDATELATINIREDNVFQKINDAQEKVEALENEAYAQSLEHYRHQCLALALQPPPSSAATQAHIEMAGDEVERLLET